MRHLADCRSCVANARPCHPAEMHLAPPSEELPLVPRDVYIVEAFMTDPMLSRSSFLSSPYRLIRPGFYWSNRCRYCSYGQSKLCYSYATMTL